jgi:putative ABC transport system permease protein
VLPAIKVTGLRVDEIRALAEHVWRVELPGVIAAGTIAGVVGLGLFLSAAGIFSLMSVSVARRRREIGVRAALGASRGPEGLRYERAGLLVPRSAGLGVPLTTR